MSGNMISREIPVVSAEPISHDDYLDVSIPIAEPVIDIVIKAEPESPNDWGYMNIGYGIDSRNEVHDMYMTIKRLGLEEWIKNYNTQEGRYHENWNKISDGLNNNNHSGASYSTCMWVTRRIFKEGGWKPGYTNKDW